MATPSDRPPAHDWPAYWLVCLEQAVTDGDYVAAARAQRELRRLGLDCTVRIVPRLGADAEATCAD